MHTSVYVPQDQLHTETGGQLIGAIVPQPSLTIQVNQSDHKTAADRDTRDQYCHQLVQADTHSSGISIVNCYRAVPVQIVNNNNNCISDENNIMISGNSASGSVHIINSDNGYFEKYVNHESQVHVNDQNENNQNLSNMHADISVSVLPKHRNTNERTYTSTEAQTDDLQTSTTNNNLPSSPTASTPLNCQSPNHGQTESLISREQRRRERRERRQARSAARAAAAAQQQHLQPTILQAHIHPMSAPGRLRPSIEILPDLLNSHLPPPYTTLPLNSAAPTSVPPQPSITAAVGPQAAATIVPPIITALPIDDARYSFPLPIIRR